ncbi:MAG TPA: hypothetical protein VMM78_02420 [Thermomicrobiales bacterium]|nr:hypothetical protein [Thermomicrobiales bacterium]
MHDPRDEQTGFLRDFVVDPLRTRRAAALALLVFAPLAGVAHAAHAGFATGMLAALCWALAPLIALGIGNGDAFFIQHGRARRRVLLTLIAGIVLSLASCVVLAGLADSTAGARRTATEGIGYGLLYLAATITLASLIAFLLGFGRDYISGRVMRMSRDDW